jgi:hypothetical protein
MRKASRLVDLDDILSTNFLGERWAIIDVVLRTHLALEACIVELIDLTSPASEPWRWPFPAKTSYLAEKGQMTALDKQAFDAYNNLRNDCAHIWGHCVNLERLLSLARELEGLGVEFSDSIGNRQPEEATDEYGGIDGVAAEISWCILFHAAYLLTASGGRDIFSQL